MKKVLFLIFTFLFVVPVSAQKIAYVDFTGILEKMPEYKKVEPQLIAYRKHLLDSLATKKHAYQYLLTKCTQQAETGYYESRPNEKTEDTKKLKALQQAVESLEQNFTTLMENKQAELVKSAQTKLLGVIEAYAKENGYTLTLCS